MFDTEIDAEGERLGTMLTEAMAEKEQVIAERDLLAKILAAPDPLAAAQALADHYQALAHGIESQLRVYREEIDALARQLFAMKQAAGHRAG